MIEVRLNKAVRPTYDWMDYSDDFGEISEQFLAIVLGFAEPVQIWESTPPGREG